MGGAEAFPGVFLTQTPHLSALTDQIMYGCASFFLIMFVGLLWVKPADCSICYCDYVSPGPGLPAAQTPGICTHTYTDRAALQATVVQYW